MIIFIICIIIINVAARRRFARIIQPRRELLFGAANKWTVASLRWCYIIVSERASELRPRQFLSESSQEMIRVESLVRIPVAWRCTVAS